MSHNSNSSYSGNTPTVIATGNVEERLMVCKRSKCKFHSPFYLRYFWNFPYFTLASFVRICVSRELLWGWIHFLQKNSIKHFSWILIEHSTRGLILSSSQTYACCSQLRSFNTWEKPASSCQSFDPMFIFTFVRKWIVNDTSDLWCLVNVCWL